MAARTTPDQKAAFRKFYDVSEAAQGGQKPD